MNTLPTDSVARKDIPLYSGVLKYAPAALAGMAKISKSGNDKHNPGEPLHHARGKSSDHADCIVRHLMDVADIEAGIVRCDQGEDWPDNYKIREAQVEELLSEASQLVWRACLFSQELHERYGGAPLAPGAKLPHQYTIADSGKSRVAEKPVLRIGATIRTKGGTVGEVVHYDGDDYLLKCSDGWEVNDNDLYPGLKIGDQGWWCNADDVAQVLSWAQ